MNNIRKAFLCDCNTLIDNFLKNGSPQFVFFCNEWKKMQFMKVYSPLYNKVEVAQLTAELILVVKKIFTSDRPQLERLCSLYILYALYFQQPRTEFIKINVTLEDWKSIKEHLEWIEIQSDTMQAKLIFWKLYKANAFRFVFTELDYGFEKFYHRNDDTDNSEHVKAEDLFKNDIQEVQQENTGFLSAFEDLEDGYNEMKEIMNKQSDFNQQLTNTSIFKHLKTSFDKIEKILTPEKETAEDGEGSQTDAASSIRARRYKLRKKAFAKSPTKLNTVEKENYQISLEGDFIQITRKGCYTHSLNFQTGQNILSDNLPEESLFELGKLEQSIAEDEK